MLCTLNNIFIPVTARPFRNDSGYAELLPCDELKPYIRCFWGTSGSYTPKSEPANIIPDICSDIIITVDLKNNAFGDHYCGISNSNFHSAGEDECSEKFTFGIRFFAWSAVMFSDNSMKNSLNDFSGTEKYFNRLIQSIKNEIFYSNDIFERKSIAERILLKQLKPDKTNAALQNSLYHAIISNGNLTVKDLAADSFISKRQLERIYADYTGVSPKQMLDLIRYQLLWQDSLKSGFNINAAIEKFGFYDQSHLLREFKKYHGTNMKDALKTSHLYNTNRLPRVII